MRWVARANASRTGTLVRRVQHLAFVEGLAGGCALPHVVGDLPHTMSSSSPQRSETQAALGLMRFLVFASLVS